MSQCESLQAERQYVYMYYVYVLLLQNKQVPSFPPCILIHFRCGCKKNITFECAYSMEEFQAITHGSL